MNRCDLTDIFKDEPQTFWELAPGVDVWSEPKR